MTSRISKKERNLIKGAIRRVFSRSELRRKVVDNSIVLCYTNPERPKVKTWCLCAICKQPEAKSYVEVDHIEPVIPLGKSMEDMSLDEVADRIWCEINNLQVVCPACHKEKTKAERKLRHLAKKEKQNESKKR
jgi:5-methylcytosine-specific restriction endonuclease McrA